VIEVGQRPAVIVAHPDDECLFAAGLVLRNWAKPWTIICCSIPRRDPIRAWKFFDACEVLGAKGRLLPSQESEPSEPLCGLPQVGLLEEFDCIVTHNQWGEYGHTHHQQVARHFADAAGQRRLITFGYRKDGRGAESIELNERERQLKAQAMRCYNHVLPYEQWEWPKWRALEHRYYEVEGMNPDVETYDVRTVH
jgi:LmbE family N-acetylglucosaminyl deacetylase